MYDNAAHDNIADCHKYHCISHGFSCTHGPADCLHRNQFHHIGGSKRGDCRILGPERPAHGAVFHLGRQCAPWRFRRIHCIQTAGADCDKGAVSVFSGADSDCLELFRHSGIWAGHSGSSPERKTAG